MQSAKACLFVCPGMRPRLHPGSGVGTSGEVTMA